MKSGNGWRLLAVVALLGIAMGPVGWGQQGSSQGSGSPGSTMPPALPPIVPPGDGPSPSMEASQTRLRNVDRQKQLVLDTQKLLTLANELKVEVDKSTKDTMSLDVIRKADEIEKLAHSVKEKMKGN
jgi:hypothetical protein